MAIASQATGNPTPLGSITATRSPRRTWTPRELIDWAIREGEPYFKPGQGYNYSDTGYVLAGLVIEKASGKPLHKAYRSLLLKPLRMDRTYLEWWERHRGPRAHNYLGDNDTYGWNPTFDTFGGGGLVSTSADLTRFMRGLFEGKLYKHPKTLRTMLRVTPQSVREQNPYGLGIERTSVAGETVWGHGGFFGAFQFYVPKRRISVTGTITQSVLVAEAQWNQLTKNSLLVALGKPATSDEVRSGC